MSRNLINFLLLQQWYEMIQRKSRDQGSENGLKVCSWRWRGYLIQVLHPLFFPQFLARSILEELKN
jgi:hypothetical protein